METIIKFLSFRAFISPNSLMFFYYLGAIGMPVAAWFFMRRLGHRYPRIGQIMAAGKEVARSSVRPRDRALLMALLVGSFLFMEILWRMMFEFLIAFLQMRDALLLLQEGSGIP